jgi:TPR repeat protein/signal transduction histidine kinase
MTEKHSFPIASLHQKASDGDAQAQFDLALCYANGTDTEKNTELAFAWHKKSADQGLVDAQLAMGLYYFLSCDHNQQFGIYYDKWSWPKGNGIKVDPVLDLAVSQALAKDMKDANDELAFMWFEKSAEQGNSEAQYWLACCYYNGIGIEQSNLLAFECFKKAAEQNFEEAYYWLALCYRDGRGIEQNNELAFEWITKAVVRADEFFHSNKTTSNYIKTVADAYLFLGNLYAHGEGIEQNDKSAFKWYEKAAEKDVAEAQYHLARCYEYGIGTEISITLAGEWYVKAAENGIVEAESQYRLAGYYLDGNGVEKNYEFGIERMIDAIRIGHIEANNWLTDIFINFAFPYLSDKTQNDKYFKYAFDWCLEEVKKDNPSAEIYLYLGILSAFGKGCEKNEDIAFKYLEKFVNDNGYDERLGELDSICRLYQWFYFCKRKENENCDKYYNWISFEDVRKALINGIYPWTNKPIDLLPLLRIDIYIQHKEYNLAKEYIENIYKDVYGVEKNFKNITLIAIEQAEELENKNKQLQKAKDELEEMMSMFAHKFRSPLDAIIYNTTHENQVKLYTEAAQTMRGLLNIFSIISTDAQILKDKIQQDRQGNGRIATVFSKTLDMILLHLLSVSGAEKIQQHYLAYAKVHGLCDAQVSYKTWCEEHFELEQQLQAEWEQSYAELLKQSAPLEQRQAWLAQHFFTLELKGFERTDIQFKEYGVTESFLTIILNEIVVNAFKYYTSESKQPVVVEWSQRESYQVLICRNPSIRSERTIIKGSHKGHAFLSTLARKTGSQFTKPLPQDDFVVEFGLPDDLLISQ